MKLLMSELGAIQCALVVGLAVLLAASPASACRARAALELGDIQYASVVVVGRIQNYEIVQATDERSKFWRAKSKSKKILSDYARFEVVVDQVLVGQPSQVIPVTWDNSTFAEPEAVKAVPYLIGLREAGSKTPPLRGPSATILPSPEPNSLTVLQAPCAPAFIFEVTSAEAQEVRGLLSSAGE
ncbi:hypothetical protein ACV356_27520 [Pseudomonas aeruginosa]